jgi:hypothetical protein
MTFWHLLILILVCWILGSVWLSMYIGHRIKMAEMEQKVIDREYEIEKLKSDFRNS